MLRVSPILRTGEGDASDNGQQEAKAQEDRIAGDAAMEERDARKKEEKEEARRK